MGFMILTYIFIEGKILFKKKMRIEKFWSQMEWISWTITARAEEKDIKSHILDMYQNTVLHDMFVYNVLKKSLIP